MEGANIHGLCDNSNTLFQDCIWTASSKGAIRQWGVGAFTLIRCRFFNVNMWLTRALSASTVDVGVTTASVVETSTGVVANFDTWNLPSTKHWLYGTSIVNFIDCPMDEANITVGYSNMGNSTRQLRLLKRFDLLVQDSSQNPIEGATVSIVDAMGDTFATLTTDSNGEIDQQRLWYKAGSHVNPSTSFTWETFTPHTITISATGYQTKTMVLTMDRKREEVVVLEKQVQVIIAKGELAVNTDPTNSQNELFV